MRGSRATHCTRSSTSGSQVVIAASLGLETDPASLNQSRRLFVCLRMIHSENRFPLFGIMHYAVNCGATSRKLPCPM